MKKIFCFDVDMTLLVHPEMTVPESAVESIWNLRKREHKIVIATGRMLSEEDTTGVRRLLEPDAIIHSNGQKVDAEGTPIYEDPIPRELIRELLGFAEEKCVNIGCTIMGEAYYLSNGKADKMLNTDLYSIAVRGGAKEQKVLADRFPNLAIIPFSSGMGADIVRVGFSKASGMDHLLRHWDKTWRDVVMFGDSKNDIQIVERAGLGIAMGNAVPELLQVADYVTDDIRRDGIKNGIEFALHNYDR